MFKLLYFFLSFCCFFYPQQVQALDALKAYSLLPSNLYLGKLSQSKNYPDLFEVAKKVTELEQLETQLQLKSLEVNASRLSPEQLREKHDDIKFFKILNQLRLLALAIQKLSTDKDTKYDKDKFEIYQTHIIRGYKSVLQQLLEYRTFDRIKLSNIETFLLPLMPWIAINVGIEKVPFPFPQYFAKIILDNLGQPQTGLNELALKERVIGLNALSTIKIMVENGISSCQDFIKNLKTLEENAQKIEPELLPALRDIRSRIPKIEHDAHALGIQEDSLFKRLDVTDLSDSNLLVVLTAITEQSFYRILINNDLGYALDSNNHNSQIKIEITQKRIYYLSKAAIIYIKRGQYRSAISMISHIFHIKERAEAIGSTIPGMASILKNINKHKVLLELFQQQLSIDSGYPYIFGIVDASYYIKSFKNTIPNIFSILELFYDIDTPENHKESNMSEVLSLELGFLKPLKWLSSKTFLLYDELKPQLGHNMQENDRNIKYSLLLSQNNNKFHNTFNNHPIKDDRELINSFAIFDFQCKYNILLAIDAQRFCTTVDDEILKAIPGLEYIVDFYHSKHLAAIKEENKDVFTCSSKFLTNIKNIRKDIDHSQLILNIKPIADYLRNIILLCSTPLISADSEQLPMSLLVNYLHKLTTQAINNNKIDGEALQSLVDLFIVASSSQIIAINPHIKSTLNEISDLFLSSSSWTPFSINMDQDKIEQIEQISAFIKILPKKNIHLFFTIKPSSNNSFIISPYRTPIGEALYFFESFPSNQKLLAKDFPKNSAILTVDSLGTAKQIISILNSGKLAGLITDINVTKDNNKNTTKIIISFKENMFGERQANDLVLLKPALVKLLCPPIKSAAAPIKPSVPEPFQYQSDACEPIKRSPPKNSYPLMKINNKPETQTIEQSSKKKKRSPTKSNKKTSHNAPATNSKILLSTNQEKASKAQETKTKTNNLFAEEGGRLSGAKPEKLIDINAPIIGNPSRKIGKSEAESRVSDLLSQRLLSLLQHTHNQMTSALESYEENEEMFFSLFSPMTIACDALVRYMDIVLHEKNEYIYAGFSITDLKLLKSLRDGLLKDIGYYHNDEVVSKQLVSDFIALTRKLNDSLFLALPVLDRRLKDLNSTETFTINWEDIRILEDKLKDTIKRGDFLCEETILESLRHLIDKFLNLTNISTLQARGLATMAGMMLEPSTIELKAGSVLKEFRIFRNLLAHPDMDLVDFESEILERLYKLYDAKKEITKEIINLQQKIILPA